jgi:putative hydrolase of HD superfamily
VPLDVSSTAFLVLWTELNTMKAEDILRLARSGEVLKSLDRTGWSLAGLARNVSESVAEHAFGTTLMALLVAQSMKSEGMEIDIGRLLTMTILHDLPEARVSDIPKTALWMGGENMERGKERAEKEAILQLLENAKESSSYFNSIWEEHQSGKTIEGRISRGSDVLDMLLHALALEESGVSPALLDDFFINAASEIDGLGVRVISELAELMERAHRERLGEG